MSDTTPPAPGLAVVAENQVLVQDHRVLRRGDDGSVTLLHPLDEHPPVSLLQSAAEIWCEYAEASSPSAVSARLCARYDARGADAEAIHRDVTEVSRLLLERQFIGAADDIPHPDEPPAAPSPRPRPIAPREIPCWSHPSASGADGLRLRPSDDLIDLARWWLAAGREVGSAGSDLDRGRTPPPDGAARIACHITEGAGEHPALEYLRHADAHRLGGIALQALGAASADAPDSEVARLTKAEQVRQRERALRLERSLVRAARALELAGARPLVLKGAAAAHLDHGVPDARTFGDIDLLLHPAEIDTAVAALLAVGGTRDLPPRTETWDRRFAKDIAITDTTGTELDLHRTLVQGPYGFWIDLDALQSGPVAFELGGVRLWAPRPAVRALHAAYGLTIAESSPRLAHAVDFCTSVGGCDTATELDDLARDCRATDLVREALHVVAAVLGVVPTAADGTSPGGFSHAATGSGSVGAPSRPRGVHSARRRYRGGGGSNTSELLAAVTVLPRTRDRFAYLRGLVFPDRRYRVARRRAGRPVEWRRGTRDLFLRRARR